MKDKWANSTHTLLLCVIIILSQYTCNYHKNIALIQLSILAFGLSSLPEDGSELATMKARVKELEAEVANYKKCMPFSDEKRSNGTSKVLINKIINIISIAIMCIM